MRCLVTGGLGFLGWHVTSELLRRGYSVECCDVAQTSPRSKHSCVRHISGDVRDLDLMSKMVAETDLVLHLSGKVGTEELFRDPKEAIDNNINGALSMLRALLNARKPVSIFFPAKPNEPNDIYTATLQAVEKLGHAYREYYGLDVRILRLPNVYGPGQTNYPVRRVVPAFIVRAINNLPIEIQGDGSQTVNLVFAYDTARIITDYMLHANRPSETHEIIFGSQLSVVELARMIVACAGSTSPIIHVAGRKGSKSMVNRTPSSDVRLLIDKYPHTPLEQGIMATISWHREQSRSEISAAH